MIKFIPIILICHSNITNTECNQNNKDVTVAFGEPQNSPISCLIEGQTRLASLAIAPKLDEPYYTRIKCVPKDITD